MVKELLLKFLRAGDIAQPAHGVRAAARNNIGLTALGPDLIGHQGHGGGNVTATGNDGDGFDAHQMEHEIIAAGGLAIAAGHALFDHKAAFQPLAHGGG